MSTHTVKRKLAAILAADAVGYSRMMGRDEERTMRVLSAHRAVIDGIIEFHEGRIINTAGDSVLAEFASPVSAMRCAVEIQDALKTRNDSLPEAERMHFRIGINLGDVMIKGDDLLGDGVNVAARLESIAESGGICISSSVYDQLAGKMDLGFVAMGEQRLKNIQRPIRAYRVTRGTDVPAAPRRTPVPYVIALGMCVIGAALWLWITRDAPPIPPTIAQVERPPVAPAPVPAPLPTANIEPVADTRRADEALITARRLAKAEMATVEARAATEIAKERAAAEMARTRADAAEQRQRDAAELAAERAKALAKPQPEPATSPPATNPEPVRIATAVPAAPIATAPTPSASRWLAERTCEARKRNSAFTDLLPVSFDGVEFRIEKGESGEAGYVILRGRPHTDGHLEMVGHGIPRAGMNRGQQIPGSFHGRREGDGYVLKGTMGRPCTLALTRR
jgi:class 3 adenylate cyclase